MKYFFALESKYRNLSWDCFGFRFIWVKNIFLKVFRWTMIVTVMTITHLIIRNLSGGISLSHDFDSDLMTAGSL